MQANNLIVAMIEDDLKRQKQKEAEKARERAEKKKSPRPTRKQPEVRRWIFIERSLDETKFRILRTFFAIWISNIAEILPLKEYNTTVVYIIVRTKRGASKITCQIIVKEQRQLSKNVKRETV